MRVIHLVYPHGDSIACPHAIGRHLAAGLSPTYKVRQYDWEDTGVIRPGSNDVLIGHPHPMPFTIFRRSLKQSGWRRILLLCPFNHSMRQVAHLCGVINNVDRFLAITGNLWVDTLSKSRYSHWAPRITNLDIGIDPSEFPRIKNSFNAQDSRRFLYIGHTDWMKNTSYLSQIASLMPNTQFSWMGRGKHGINGLKSLGYQDFRSQDSKDLVATHDFVITVSTADANPATVIEAMAWGLIPVCTPQCGYVNFPGIPLIPLNNAVEAVRVLQSLQAAPVEELIRIRDQNSELIRTQFTWDEFTRKVITAVEAVDRPRLYPPPATLRIISWIAWTASLLSPRAWRPLIKARTIPKGR